MAAARTVPDDVTDDEGDAGAGQRNEVEPVAPDPRLGGQVPVGDLERGLLGELAGQQAALQGDGHGVFAGEAAGVVDRHGGAGRQLLGGRQVLRLEGPGALHAPEVREAEHDAARLQGHADQ